MMKKIYGLKIMDRSRNRSSTDGTVVWMVECEDKETKSRFSEVNKLIKKNILKIINEAHRIYNFSLFMHKLYILVCVKII